MQLVLNNRPAPSMAQLEDKNVARAELAQEYNKINNYEGKTTVA